MASLFFLPFYVYIIQSESTGILYKGFTEDYYKREFEHNNGLSRYTNGKGPWKLIYVEELPDKKSALIREKKLKRANKNYLLWLICQPINIVRQ